MRINSLLLCGLLLLFLKPPLSAQGLIIRMQDGTENQMTINSVRKLGFSNDELVVTPKTGQPESYNINDIRKLYFGVIASVTSDVSAASAQLAITPNPADNVITLVNLPSGTSVIYIFSFDGRLVQQVKMSSPEPKIDISALKSGIYFISGNGQTAKFVKL